MRSRSGSPAGSRSRPTIRDVAQAAGVSPAAVSYIVSGPSARAARISDETRTRILDAVAELGYEPNQSARTLRLQRTNRVLFLGSRITSLYSQVMARSIADGLGRFGLGLDIQIGTDAAHIRRAVRALEQSQADGLILETGDESLEVLRDAADRGHAIVAIGPSRPEPAFDVISNDDAPAIRDAMAHAVARGPRYVVLLSSYPEPREHRIRVALEHLRTLGLPDDAITVLHCRHDQVGVHDAALAFLPRLPRPLAVYAGADVSAIGVLWAAIGLGIRVPEELAIIGHGNTPETRITAPPLTTLGPVSVDFGKAADLIASRLADPALPGRHIAEPCQLTIRGSS